MHAEPWGVWQTRRGRTSPAGMAIGCERTLSKLVVWPKPENTGEKEGRMLGAVASVLTGAGPRLLVEERPKDTKERSGDGSEEEWYRAPACRVGRV